MGSLSHLLILVPCKGMPVRVLKAILQQAWARRQGGVPVASCDWGELPSLLAPCVALAASAHQEVAGEEVTHAYLLLSTSECSQQAECATESKCASC